MNEKIQDYIENRLFDFLDEAKPQGYGSNAEWTNDGPFKTIAVTDPINPEVKYTDRYVGAEMFSGIETVTFGDTPIYAMSYSGVEYIPFKEDSRIFECLSKALTSRNPVYIELISSTSIQVRGLKFTTDSEEKWIYLNKEEWIWSRHYFSGTEVIVSVEFYNYMIDKVGDNEKAINMIMNEIQKKEALDWENALMGVEDNKKWLAFRCDYSGGLIKD